MSRSRLLGAALALTPFSTAEATWNPEEPLSRKERENIEKEERRTSAQELKEIKISTRGETAAQVKAIQACVKQLGQPTDVEGALLLMQGDAYNFRWHSINGEGSFGNYSDGLSLYIENAYAGRGFEDFNGDGYVDRGAGTMRDQWGDYLFVCTRDENHPFRNLRDYGRWKNRSFCPAYEYAYMEALAEADQICQGAMAAETLPHDPVCSGVTDEERLTSTAQFDTHVKAIPQLHLSVRDAEGELRQGACSGTFVGDNLILTAGHCVEGMEDITVSWQVPGSAITDKLYHSPVEVVDYIFDETEPRQDIALLALSEDAPIERHLPLVFSESAEGSYATIGHPMGSSWTYSSLVPPKQYILTDEGTTEKFKGMFLFNGGGCFGPGNSGGPVLNGDGVQAIVVQGQFMLGRNGYAVNLADHKGWLESHMGGEINRPANGQVKLCTTESKLHRVGAEGAHFTLLPSDNCRDFKPESQ